MRSIQTANKIYIFLRVAVLLILIMVFIPAINPAKICGLVNRNLSLFTSGSAYSQLTADFGRALKKDWVQASTLKLLFTSSLAAILGISSITICGCMSLGNIKLKRLGNWYSIIGCLILIGGLCGIYQAYQQIILTTNPEKVKPDFPEGIQIFLIIALIILIVSLFLNFILPKADKQMKYELPAPYKLFLMFLPFLALTFVFSYLSLWGWRYAFFDYKVGDTLSMKNFVGFKWFTYLFRNPATMKDILRVIKNTLAMSGLGLAFSWLPIAFAIFLAEMKNTKIRRFVQTFTTVPNFISWVLVYAVALAIFSTDGFISSLMIKLGIWENGRNFLMSDTFTYLKMWLWGTWKGLGWCAIIYIAAISGIDQQLYEAATVDGAGRFQRMWHITVPGLIPTYCVLLLLSIANILSNGFDQYLVFENASNTSSITVLDLYVYKLGINNGLIPISTVVGMLKSLISVTLLFSANKISKWIRGESII